MELDFGAALEREIAARATQLFVDDYQFERVWAHPERYIDKLSKYALVATPDFSTYSDMPLQKGGSSMAKGSRGGKRRGYIGKVLVASGAMVDAYSSVPNGWRPNLTRTINRDWLRREVNNAENEH